MSCCVQRTAETQEPRAVTRGPAGPGCFMSGLHLGASRIWSVGGELENKRSLTFEAALTTDCLSNTANLQTSL